MIEIHVLRVAVCELCCAAKALLPDDAFPERCWECNSPDWMYGLASRKVLNYRMGHLPKPKLVKAFPKTKFQLDSSLRGKRQWRQFKDKQGNPIPGPNRFKGWKGIEPIRHRRP